MDPTGSQGKFSTGGALCCLPIRNGVGGFAIKFIHSLPLVARSVRLLRLRGLIGRGEVWGRLRCITHPPSSRFRAVVLGALRSCVVLCSRVAAPFLALPLLWRTPSPELPCVPSEYVVRARNKAGAHQLLIFFFFFFGLTPCGSASALRPFPLNPAPARFVSSPFELPSLNAAGSAASMR